MMQHHPLVIGGYEWFRALELTDQMVLLEVEEYAGLGQVCDALFIRQVHPRPFKLQMNELKPKFQVHILS